MTSSPVASQVNPVNHALGHMHHGGPIRHLALRNPTDPCEVSIKNSMCADKTAPASSTKKPINSSQGAGSNTNPDEKHRNIAVNKLNASLKNKSKSAGDEKTDSGVTPQSGRQRSFSQPEINVQLGDGAAIKNRNSSFVNQPINAINNIGALILPILN
jgi:hypothetical protein